MAGTDSTANASTDKLTISLSGDQYTVSIPAPVSTSVPGDGAGVCDVEQEMDTLRIAISAINKLRPRFVVVTGSFTHAYPLTASPASPSSSLSSSTLPSTNPASSTPASSASATQTVETLRDLQLNQFMRTMARVSETIPLLFVPGDRDVGESEAQSS